MNWLKSACFLILLTLTVCCERLPHVGAGSARNIPGFYLLNEGEEGTNKCTLDYYDIPSMVFVISSEINAVVDVKDQLPCSDMAVCGDSLYVLGNVMNYFTQSSEINYSIVDVRTHVVVTDNFITDGTDKEIENPYGIAVNPQTREIFITDARDSVTPGKVYCFSPGGVLKWSTHTGDIPSRIVFTHKPLL